MSDHTKVPVKDLLPDGRLSVERTGEKVSSELFADAAIEYLEERERQIARLQRYQERMERLASLGALAAGAAHELGTPLGTISLIAQELERTGAAHAREIFFLLARLMPHVPAGALRAKFGPASAVF
ncbi:MAG: hypothetical protein ACKOCH_22480, partial [Bacteroidota bacterium]